MGQTLVQVIRRDPQVVQRELEEVRHQRQRVGDVGRSAAVLLRVADARTHRRAHFFNVVETIELEANVGKQSWVVPHHLEVLADAIRAEQFFHRLDRELTHVPQQVVR